MLHVCFCTKDQYTLLHRLVERYTYSHHRNPNSGHTYSQTYQIVPTRWPATNLSAVKILDHPSRLLKHHRNPPNDTADTLWQHTPTLASVGSRQPLVSNQSNFGTYRSYLSDGVYASNSYASSNPSRIDRRLQMCDVSYIDIISTGLVGCTNVLGLLPVDSS